jgi:hypothetical protein
LLELLHAFLHRSSRLVPLGLPPAGEKFERFLEALFLGAFFFGDTPLRGAVTFHAHWAVLEHWFQPASLIARIKDSYPPRRQSFRAIFDHVERDRQSPADAFLLNMSATISAAITSAYQDPSNLARSIEYAANEQSIELAHSLLDSNQANFAFLDTLYGESRYLADVDFNPAVQVTRLVVNLLYQFGSQLGLRAVDRFAACYYIQQTIAEACGGNYSDTLKGFVERAQQHAATAAARQAL